MKKLLAILLSASLAVPVAAGTIAVQTAKAEELTVVTEEGDYDVVVYGATSAGVTAAIAAKKEGADVLLVAQNELIGGLTSSGLGATDMANEKVVGGLSYEFYNRMYEYYLDDSVWTSQTREEYFELLGKDIYSGKDDALRMQWVFEPHVAEQIFEDMLIDYDVPVIFNERIDLGSGVIMDESGSRIEKLVTESGKEFGAKVFIDCSYEGDLMAESGVTYTVGREANSEYGETMNGILPNNSEIEMVSPYIVEGDPDSGLLPFIEDGALGAKGDEDSRVQAYCFRFTLSTDPENRVPITKPENYHPEWYETRARIFLNNPDAECELTLSNMPNSKTDTNHADFVGMSYEYADGDYLSRKNIEDDHRDYVLGLLYFYAYDERVPEEIREMMRGYGLAKDEFDENGNFPVQIYLREGRRMVSDYVMKESDVITQSVPGVIQKTTAPHSVGQGFYWFDSHRVAYYRINAGDLGDGYQTDGNFWQSRRDYPISYESIRPKVDECVNLYVPVCLSATHAAYGSIRMETTYMIVAESAGTAAAMSAAKMEEDAGFKVQDLDYAELAVRLAANGQYLGDIVAEDLSDGELSVLKLTVSGLVDGETAEVLYGAVSGGFDTEAEVLAVRDVMYAAAQRIDSGAALIETLKILSKYSIISNTAEWESLFSDTPPAGLPVGNVIGVFNAITKFFANESGTGYITDWVNYFFDNGIIDEDTRDYFDDNAVSGRTCDTAKTRALLIAIARTIEPSVNGGDAALQLYQSTGMIGNPAAWKGIFDGTAKNASGSNVSSLLQKAYSHLIGNESRWQGRIGTACLDYLAAMNVFSADDAETYTALLSGTKDGASVSSAVAMSVIVNGAKYFDASADSATALNILSEKGIDISGLTAVPGGAAAEGAAMRAFLTALETAMRANPVIEPLTEELLQPMEDLGILTAEESGRFIADAVFAGSVNYADIEAFLSRISSRLSAPGTTYAEKLMNAGIIDEMQKAALDAAAGSVLDGGVANGIIREVVGYVSENNEGISSAYASFLTKNNIITSEETASLNTISTFGFASKTLVQKIFIGLAKYIDGTVNDDIASALSLLSDINAVLNEQSWNDNFAGEGTTLYGNDCLTVINTACAFAVEDGTLEDYRYLSEKGHISAEDAAYFVRHGNNSNTADRKKVVDLLIALGKGMDTDGSVTDGATAIAEIKANGVITNDAAWLAVVGSEEATWTVTDLWNLVDKSVARIKLLEESQGEIEELSDAVLDYFVAQGFFEEGTFGREYWKEATTSGSSTTLNQGKTQEMLIRTFRVVAGTTGKPTGSALTAAIDACGFTFSDDPSEDTTLREYWYARITAKNPVDNDMLRVLMERIYNYMNSGV